MQIIKIKMADIVPYENNVKLHPKEQIEQIKKSIVDFGNNDPIAVDENNVIIEGHGRYEALKELGYEEAECIVLTGLTEDQKNAYRLVHNKLTMNSDFDMKGLEEELNKIDMDLTAFDFDPFNINEEEKEIIEDEVPEVDEEHEPITKMGDIWQLGNHRLMCGDSTKIEDVEKIMNGNKADMVFTDPPYGMKKEKEGVLNDNLNYTDLLEFNKKWIPLTFAALKDNGSWYCWGIDEPLMDIYSEIIKPMIKENKITFRNLLTWDKGHGQGQKSEEFRMYPIADEKCLFVMCGVQGFNTNADNYFEGWEPIRNYLLESRLAMGWDVPTMKRIAGHSDLSSDHWTGKSQWNMPTREVYEKFQRAAEKQREENNINNDAFRRDYDALKSEYDALKSEYYSTRAYFNNIHDNMNNVWHFDRTSNKERELTGGHATPKPIALCSRAIESSSRKGESVLDLFGGSGSTLIACEQLDRKCYMMELDPKYCDVIIKRWETLTGKKAKLIKEEK